MQDLSIKISAIVPIYNAEKTIRKCIESLLDQTYAYFEVVLIDDGSTDESKAIVEEMIKDDSRIAYYQKTNGGVSSARNLGISKARGEYIAFIDADDRIHPQMFEMLIHAMESCDADIVACQYTTNSESLHKNVSNCKITKVAREEYFHEMFIPTDFIAAFVWNRLYKAELIQSNKIKFDENIKICEDTLFNYLYAKKCRNIALIIAPLYYYNINENSAMFSTKFNINKLNANVVYDYMLNDETNDKVINDIQVACMWFNEIVMRQINMLKVPVSADIKQDIKRRLKLNPAGFMKAEIPMKYKIAYIIYALS